MAVDESSSSSSDSEEEEGDRGDVLEVQKVLLNRLYGHAQTMHGRKLRSDQPTLFGVEAQERELYERLVNAAEMRESTSVILCGPRGSGKHTAVRRALAKLGGCYDVAHLHGLLHNDGAAGLRELVRQIAVNSSRSKYVDDLTVFTEALSQRRTEEAAPLLVVLSHLEAFALQFRQTLLYTLLDATQTQGKQGSIVVLGITTDRRVVDHFEKRVRSRLQNHQISFGRPLAKNDVLAGLDDRLFLGGDSTNDAFAKHDRAWKKLKRTKAFDASISRAVALGRPFKWYESVAGNAILNGLTEAGWMAAVEAQEPTTSQAWITAVAAMPPPQVALVIAYLRFERDDREHYSLDAASQELQRLAKTNAAAMAYPPAVLLRAQSALLESAVLILVHTTKSVALEPSTLRFANVRLSGAIRLEDLWTALRQDLLRCPTVLRQWALQGHQVMH